MRNTLFTLLMVMTMLMTACVAGVAEMPAQGSVQEASEAEVLAGGEFNKFFPADADGLELVYTQEKEGFAQAALTQDGEEMATLSVSDTANTPDTRDKFEGSSDKIAGFPVASVGSLGTALLVANRFQIQVRSKSDAFGEEERIAWLEAFDLNGLSGLK